MTAFRARWLAALVGGVWTGAYAAVHLLAYGPAPLTVALAVTSAACLITYDVARERESTINRTDRKDTTP